MQIRKAKLDDFQEVIKIFKDATKDLKNRDIDQWNESYPSNEIIKLDIINNQMYLGTINNTIVSVFVINDSLEGDCTNETFRIDFRFKVLHRLCVNVNYQNQMVGTNTMKMIEIMLKNEGINSIRLDAYSMNSYAIKLYESLDYKKVGEVYFEGRKEPFYLYEKEI